VSKEQQGVARRQPSRRKHIDENELAKKRRAFNEKILDKIVADPKFRDALLVDPHAALRSSGLDSEMRDLEQSDAVLARDCGSSCLGTCQASCKTFTCVFTASC
jgi:hypothetical protein